ncbi:hypothetical protein L226DRAFT_574122 [Lentinus tigrinus ALCF2SS1-7]|uniref:Uncharacterized protein n=1 Tax=Lentinus tigrinus ALCF2SS1-6 TaxID=1328759 RepID=A0A5C2S0F9_9APHY|nr:hypothetical protein L227DRAFT_614144 [Lentinus tigrinus ALCF2SS1-6]RPD71109.1 hypothetical protein L226DRAFT_574122 [Lentinus tigrinus ALCF2SS1-7]
MLFFNVPSLHSPYISPASMHILSAIYEDMFTASVSDLTIAQLNKEHHQYLCMMASSPAMPVPSTTLGNGHSNGNDTPLFPTITSPCRLSLSLEFPKVCIVLGNAE